MVQIASGAKWYTGIGMGVFCESYYRRIWTARGFALLVAFTALLSVCFSADPQDTKTCFALGNTVLIHIRSISQA